MAFTRALSSPSAALSECKKVHGRIRIAGLTTAGHNPGSCCRPTARNVRAALLAITDRGKLCERRAARVESSRPFQSTSHLTFPLSGSIFPGLVIADPPPGVDVAPASAIPSELSCPVSAKGGSITLGQSNSACSTGPQDRQFGKPSFKVSISASGSPMEKATRLRTL